MRDNGTPTSVKIESGTPVYLADKPCTGCGCYQAFVFECNCGAVHSDVCYNCGGNVDIEHEPIEQENALSAREGVQNPWSVRCRAGRAEHTHTWPAAKESVS